MRLNEAQLREIVASRISVTSQKIAVAKGLLLKHYQPHAEGMMQSALRELGIRRPERVVVKIEGESAEEVDALGDYFSWSLCAVEALWGLIHSGIMFPAAGAMSEISTTAQVFHVSSGSSGGGGEDFSAVIRIPAFPTTVLKSRSETAGFLLTDPDLFLDALQPHVPTGDLAEALREAIRCFRHDLYMASAVMLGKASEGIWIELGKALIDALPKPEQTGKAAFRADLDNAVRPSFAMKLRDISRFYETTQKQLAVVGNASGVSLDQFRVAWHWSDTVRDSRNVVHYGSQPNLPNNYENVSTLLLTGSTHLRNLLKLHSAAVANAVT
jgi:hypothetical protein